MRDRARFAIAGLLMILAVGAAIYLAIPREPSFEGKSLTDWVWMMQHKLSGAEKEKARVVVQQLASNSIPLLLRWLREDYRPPLRERLEPLREKILFWLMRHKIIKDQPVGFTSYFHPSHSFTASSALAELSASQQQVVIPKLIQMLGEHEKPLEPSFAAGAAYRTLAIMIPESTPALIAALTNQDLTVKALSVCALEQAGPDAKVAIPILRPLLTDSDPQIRLFAASSIERLHGNPEEFMPIVIQSLRDTNLEWLDFQIDLLVKHKAQARAAVPILASILTQTAGSTNVTNVMAHEEARHALMEIAPDEKWSGR